MNNRKYPTSLFIIGFIMNIFFHFFWIFVPAVVLMIVGIFVAPCLYIGLAILALDVVLSLIEQIKIRNTFLKDSDNPDFQAFQDALSKDGGWTDNFGELLEQKLSENQNEITADDESEDE